MSDDATDLERLRDDREAVPRVPPDLRGGGTSAIVGTVTTADADIEPGGIITVAEQAFAGSETHGGTASSAPTGVVRKVVNLGPRLPRNGAGVVADFVEWGWAYQEPACNPCELRADKKYKVALPFAGAGVSTVLTAASSTDNRLALANFPGAPRARDGIVWKSNCLRVDPYDDGSCGEHYRWADRPCDALFTLTSIVSGQQYGDYAWSWHDYLFELFCNGDHTQLLIYPFVTAVVLHNQPYQATFDPCYDDGFVPPGHNNGNYNCARPAAPASSCPFAIDTTKRFAFGSWGALQFTAGAWSSWLDGWAPRFGVLANPTHCAPFHLVHKYQPGLTPPGVADSDYDLIVTEEP